jgi:RNA polymerase sigma-70 factor (ECF subfamily)
VYTSIDEIIRVEGGRVVATLCRLTGDLDLAEDAFAEAAIEAVRRWPTDGLPVRPGAWLTTVARRKALDVLRRERRRPDRERAAVALRDEPDVLEVHTVRDDQLRLIFTTCHPAIAAESQVALALRVLCGLTTDEIARAFLLPAATVGKRITRAKDKLRANAVAFRVPPDEELPGRLSAVLSVVEVVFATGHHPPLGDQPVRVDLLDEGVRLARLLVELMPDEPECHGLLALLLSTRARHPGALDADGVPVLLADADRTSWDHESTAEAVAILERALRVGRAGPRQLRAAISCLHSTAATVDETDWPQIIQLYDMLQVIDPSPAVRVNRAVAVGEVAGPDAALAELDALAGDPSVDGWHLFHAARAEQLRRLGRADAARAALGSAIACPHNDADDRLLRARLTAL